MDDYVDENVLEIAVSDVAEVKYDSKVKDIITETEVDCSKVETPLYDVIDENNAIVVSKSKEEPPPTGFNVGSSGQKMKCGTMPRSRVQVMRFMKLYL